MKKFNFFKEIITAEKKNLLEAINSGKKFAIKVDGDICYEPFGAHDMLIYAGSVEPNTPIEVALGKNYQVVEDNERVLIKAFANWQEIIGFNKLRATYDDTTADGVDEFGSNEMEDIGWHATEFNITYRTLVEVIEEKCDGTLLCLEQDNPYQFSGLGFINNLDDARDTLFNYCQKEIKRLIAEDEDFTKNSLSDDEREAAEFFKAL
ncbi:hypothetical protein [Sulfurimonas sp.]|jgi:hypothetical protein|uniref:hypothetical protein n=1 Tax=Sulfurimonas sp. TaxID=2022749 RepID=UPI0025F0F8E1|nr:hypothetical protein [Sulfurimonas sp.]MCK9472286.1 hypothetical protein [Sulfurimonas sp.]